MTKEDGLITLVEIIDKDTKHQDYKRVKELAELYYKMVTGNGISDLLRQIVSRETEAEFNMRKLITNSVIPPTLGSTKLPFQKAVRKKARVRKMDWETKDYEAKKQKLEDFIGRYWGDASLEKFLEYAFVDYNYIDPNAFLITEFDAFDPMRELPDPYPFIATSEQCIMFEVNNNLITYLVVELPIKFMRDEIETDGKKYTMYLGMDTIQLTEVDKKIEGFEVIEIKKKYYKLEYFEPKNEKVPARRFGYRRDAETQGRTFVSCFHDIIPYLNKTLKIDSELDLSSALVAFPQRLMYVPPCKNCNKGKLPDGEICPVCDGSGKEPFHNSVMDVITLDMPREIADIVDLEKLLVYKGPPIDLLTFQKEYIAELRASVFLMMFNKELFSKTEVTETATEKILETDNMNDTLKPFAQALSTMWEFVVEDIATYTDLRTGLTVEHLFPDDFKFKSQNELMEELKRAKDASASTSTIAAIEDDINEILYADRPEELKAIRVKNAVNPFRGYNEENIRLLISQGMTTRYNVILWANLEAIFNELEQEYPDPWIYDMAMDKILKLVTDKVIVYIEKIDSEKPKEPELPFKGLEEEEEPESQLQKILGNATQ